MHTYVIYCEGLRLPAIFSHFTCTAPFSAGFISTNEVNLMSTHILKVCHVQFTSAKCLNGQSADMQYQILMHLSTFLILIRSFLLDVFI